MQQLACHPRQRHFPARINQPVEHLFSKTNKKKNNRGMKVNFIPSDTTCDQLKAFTICAANSKHKPVFPNPYTTIPRDLFHPTHFENLNRMSKIPVSPQTFERRDMRWPGQVAMHRRAFECPRQAQAARPHRHPGTT